MIVSPRKILLVEDEKDLAEPLCGSLEDEGYCVHWVDTGEKARQRFSEHWDLIILDLMLPDLSGETLLHYLRQEPDYPAVLVLSARGALDDKLSLFRQGCDDYVTKPYLYEELLARVRALLRRSQRVQTENLIYEGVLLDPEKLLLQSKKNQVQLTPKEVSILKLFFSSPGKVISRKEILEKVWGLREEPNTNFIGVHLFNLRKKLAEAGIGDWMQTIRNSGFVFIFPKSSK